MKAKDVLEDQTCFAAEAVSYLNCNHNHIQIKVSDRIHMTYLAAKSLFLFAKIIVKSCFTAGDVCHCIIIFCVHPCFRLNASLCSRLLMVKCRLKWKRYSNIQSTS